MFSKKKIKTSNTLSRYTILRTVKLLTISFVFIFLVELETTDWNHNKILILPVLIQVLEKT